MIEDHGTNRNCRDYREKRIFLLDFSEKDALAWHHSEKVSIAFAYLGDLGGSGYA